jgi:hypothetical protein
MATHDAVGALAAALLLSLACAGGDLTLPGPDGPGSPEPAAPRPARLVVASGDGQQAEPGALLPEPVAVQVLDSALHPVPGTPVSFSFAAELGGAVDPASTLTDGNGTASAVVRLGDVPGEQVIVAAVADPALPGLRASFSATAVPPGGAGDGKKDHGHDHGGGGGD